MGGGREGGSPSAASAVVAAAMSSSMIHRLERQELLEGGNNSTYLRSPSRTPPRTPPSMSPLHSPRSLSPLHSPKIAPLDPPPPVDFHQAILRSSHIRKSSSLPKPDEIPPPPVADAAIRKSRSDIPDGRHKSPFNSGRFRAEDVPQEQDPVAPSARHGRPDLGMATQDKILPSEWVLSDKGKSPRRVQEMAAAGTPTERKSSRSSTRRAKTDMQQDLQEGDLGMGDANRVSRRAHLRTHTRQHKRKAADPVIVSMPPSSSLQPPYLLERPAPHASDLRPPYTIPHASATESASAHRRSNRGASINNHAAGMRASESSDWVQFLVDIFMWRHVPRSALLFGVGCFCILSMSVIQDMHFSAISVFAYIALLYLAATFFRRTFLRGATPASLSSLYMLTEADALNLVRLLLPPVNSILIKLSDLFSGEPTVTLKVAVALWLLIQAGHIMNLWSLARLAYFALFVIPKCYSCYNEQIHVHARSFLHWAWARWDACSHKKAVLIAALALAWNLSSVSTRVCGAFISVVALRAYQHVIRAEVENNGNSTFFSSDKPYEMSSAPSRGLELVTLPQSGFERKR